MIKGIREKTGVEISCEDDGSVELVGTDVEQLDIAKQMVLEIAVEPEVGSVIRYVFFGGWGGGICVCVWGGVDMCM